MPTLRECVFVTATTTNPRFRSPWEIEGVISGHKTAPDGTTGRIFNSHIASYDPATGQITTTSGNVYVIYVSRDAADPAAKQAFFAALPRTEAGRRPEPPSGPSTELS